ncbi:TBC1 domain family member 4-like [Pecten maximus]|uniref:TBC1 domain family member 4-like n=1 Tax=Pecten maximus TaxID=6579 RepID=UPI0014583EBF|nr:TBC1 domain family member 4-like [Pecten maximus]
MSVGEMASRRNTFIVMYLGNAILDRRYPPQFVMPWVMAEVKRRKEAFREIRLDVMTHVLRATGCLDNTIIFEHTLQSLSKFAKTHQDARCFAYLTRHDLYCDYECHVFLAHNEAMVPELFNSIQEATRRDITIDMVETKASEPAKAFYEVMYVGRAKLNTKKITCVHIDELCHKLSEKEKERKQKQEEQNERRQRHASGASVKSLPASLDEVVSVTENELGAQNERLRGNTIHIDSPSSSADDLSGCSDGISSSENVLENSGHFSHSYSTGGLSGSGDSREEICDLVTRDPLSHSNSGDLDQSQKELHVHFSDPHHCESSRDNPNKTMLFCLGASDISLISLDKKSTILDRRFKDISSVSQGKERPEVFGFIAREKGNTFICYILKCHSCSVVDEIMAVLRSAFQSAYEQNRQQICQMCPLHQLHRLCQEINNLSPQDAYELLVRRIQNLPERDTALVHNILKMENPQSYDEMVEIVMIGLRKLCENKQKEHSHISDSKMAQKTEFNLLEGKGKAALALDNLKNRCKKSLAHSFDNLLGRKKEDAKEAFRQRSGTADSESSMTRSMDSSATSTPEASPMPSPAFTKDVHFQFPTGPSVPIETTPPSSPKLGRPRSSTVGAMPDAALKSRYSNKGHLETPQEDFKQHASRRASTNSPMKQMFLFVGSGSRRTTPEPSADSSSNGTPHNYTPKRRGSWRQAIFSRVVTPARAPVSPALPEKQEDIEVEKEKEKAQLSQQEIRSLWKKAILQTLLLIRMEKEKQDIKARQSKALEKPSLDYEEITPCLKDITRDWEEMLQSNDRHTSTIEPRKLLNCVKQGVPKNHRGDIWWLLVEQHQLHYPDTQANMPSRDYNELLRELTEYQHNILIDLGRTFPGHPYFSAQLGPGQLMLYNLLKAYSLLDKEVGYCQGLSFIAGILLMHMDENLAWETLRHMMFNLGLRRQFQPNMMPLQIQLYQLTRLIHDNYKDLHDHFEDYEIAPNLYATPWFLTLFASQFPLGFVARMFDLFLMQGVEVLLKVALVLLGNHKELILQCDSFEGIVEFIKTTLPEMGIIQMERVINQVFEMDITKQLHAYEVEYHVLREEMLYSPTKGEADLIHKLEDNNQKLKQQNVELLEKLQYCNSHQRSLDSTIHSLQTKEAKLKSHIKTLEIERKALLNAVTKLKQLVSEDEFQKLDICLPPMAPSLPSSPCHQPIGGASAAMRTINNKLAVKRDTH